MPKNKGNDAGTAASLPAGFPGPARSLEVSSGRSDLPAIFPCLSSGSILCVLPPVTSVADTTRSTVPHAASPSLPPCPRIKEKEVKTDVEERMRMNLKSESWCSKRMGQEYAQVIKMLGNGRLEAMCFNGVKRLCHIRGKLRKKFWINTSDIILVGLRDYQDNKADVILKYNADEARSLKAYGELPEHAKINKTDTFGLGDDDEIQFDDIGDDDEDIDDI
ncbi:Eukaryotic translation initiation factor 1A, X-chromosomal [Microtus ochrogaster]|uniref:Eukaryotic translation initiation factor 1A, X-chromosomal n=1 Tax=Microtus ochrogaster TaxID=79684 RepID=A0A8J6G0S2_MICOH|nr:Eukaryotic translation initiation factor 1A, X-chromosomal [Microtus ochrogaster]